MRPGNFCRLPASRGQNERVSDGPEGSGAFVGRHGPRARIRAAFGDSLAGKARLVLVSGESGIGKTALLTEAVREAAGSGATTAWGTCWDAERAPGYWPWAQVVRQMVDRSEAEILDSTSDADRADLARLVPDLGSAAPVTVEEPDSPRAQFRFFDAVARWLERSARQRPVVVAFDDLHWADGSSLALLEFVVRAHRPVPLLLLGAYRHDELRDDVAALFADISLRADNVRLQGLSVTEVRELLDCTGGGEVAESWGEDVHRRTAGHPFLVRELSHALPTQEPIDVVPAAAHDLIAGRLGRVSADCRRLLDAAAVAGNEVLPDVLGDVLDLPAAAVATRLGDAIRAGVLTGAGCGAGRVRFAHDLYRETIYTDLPTPRRLELHRQIGVGLERRLARGGAVFPGEVARHFSAAAAVDGPDRAIHWALEAAAAHRGRLAFAEAASQLSRVRSVLDGAGVAVPTTTLVDFVVAQADAESRAGNADRARELLHEAHVHAVRLQDPERLSAVALWVQRLGARHAMPRTEVVALLDEARRAVEGRAPAVEAQVTASLARELYHSLPRDRARAGPLSEHAMAIARRLDDPAVLAACLLARHDVLWTPGAAAERVEVGREIVALAEQAGDDERRSEGHLLTANALLETGSPAFRTELDAFLRLEDRLGQPRHDYLALTRRAGLAILDGSLDEGERLVHEAAALGERIGEPEARNLRMSQLIEVARARGEPSRLVATAQMAVACWVGLPSLAHAVAAGLLADAGDVDGARRALDTVRELGTWSEDRSYVWSVSVGGLTAAAARLGDLDLSGELLTELAPLAGTCGVNGTVVCFLGSHAHWAGVGAKALGRTEEARDLLLRALRAHERVGARAWEAETCAVLAELGAGATYHDRAAGLAGQFGLVGVAARLERIGRAGPRGGKAADAVCRHDGDVWSIEHRGRSARLRDAKGLHDLSALLARPAEDIHVLDLVGSGIRGRDSTIPVLDPRARADFKRRITDLDEDLAEAEAHHDLGRFERVESERDSLLDELRRATGHAGRDRGLGPSTVERARKAVTARLRDTIGRIEVVLPELGSHLDRSIVTGTHCRYQPAEPLTWDLQVRPKA